MTSAYLAIEGLEAELEFELGPRIIARHGLLRVAEGAGDAAWAANIWHDVVETPVASIGDAATQLRAVQRNWSMYAPLHHGRAKLIEAKLPHVAAKPLVFPAPAPAAPLGAWTLLAPDRLLYAARCSSAVPNGEWTFVEDRVGPPNRAYLKLWEALTRLGALPKPGELCLDLGASPGGWTWVLAQLGANVVAVDKAVLDPRVMALPNVTLRQESAFALDPKSYDAVDWLFSDVICYPARLFKLIERWRAAGRVRNFVCTLKFQGETDHETARAFASLPGAQLFHLHHNKHELTFALLGG